MCQPPWYACGISCRRAFLGVYKCFAAVVTLLFACLNAFDIANRC